MNVLAVKYTMLPHYIGDKPKFAYSSDAGIDLKYCGKEPICTFDREVSVIPTGLCFAVPEGYCGLVMERSGLGKRYGLTLHGRVLDAGYRGELFLLVSTRERLTVDPGLRIAQIVFVPHLTTLVQEPYNKLGDTDRGKKGFGSSGIK